MGLGLVVVLTLIVGAPKSSSYRNASDRAEEPSGTVKPDAKYDESPVVATLSFVISTRLKMSPTFPSSCEGIMPHIICFGEVTFNFNIDGTTLLLLMVLLVVLGTVLLKILKLLKSIFH